MLIHLSLSLFVCDPQGISLLQPPAALSQAAEISAVHLAQEVPTLAPSISQDDGWLCFVNVSMQSLTWLTDDCVGKKATVFVVGGQTERPRAGDPAWWL